MSMSQGLVRSIFCLFIISSHIIVLSDEIYSYLIAKPKNSPKTSLLDPQFVKSGTLIFLTKSSIPKRSLHIALYPGLI